MQFILTEEEYENLVPKQKVEELENKVESDGFRVFRIYMPT